MRNLTTYLFIVEAMYPDVQGDLMSSQYLTAVGRILLVLSTTVLIWVGLTHIFTDTYAPAVVAQQHHSPQPVTQISRSFHASVFTSDRKFTTSLDVAPNCAGPNVFTIDVIDNGTNTSTTLVSISMSTTMLDMKMGTQTVNVHPDGKGHFQAKGDLPMGGDWGISIQLRTPDKVTHEAMVNVLTPC